MGYKRPTMKKSATQVVQDALFATLCDAVLAFRENAGGMPNALARDLASVNSNATMDTIPESVQKAIRANTHELFKRLTREGYEIGEKQTPRRK